MLIEDDSCVWTEVFLSVNRALSLRSVTVSELRVLCGSKVLFVGV